MDGFHVALGQFLFGALASVATILTVIKTFPAERQKEQRIVAVFFSVILSAILTFNLKKGIFSQAGGWVLLPIIFIAPALFIIDWIKRKKDKFSH